MNICEKIVSVQDCRNYIHVKTNGGQFQIYLLDNDTVRFRCTFQKEFAPEHSYALVKTAWDDELDTLLQEERCRVEPLHPALQELPAYWSVKTGTLEIRLCKEPFGIEIYDLNGKLLYQDLKERAFLQDSMGRCFHYSVIDDTDHFYGFGEKTGPLNKAKYTMRMHNMDACGHDAELSDPLYKHIPFYIRFNETTRHAIGLFYNNAHDSVFDMGRERSGYWSKYSYFCADGGDLDLFFINGPQIRDVVERYTDLTGKTALPPITSIGYMGTTMFYTELEEGSDDAILEFIDTCKKHDIPIDGFLLASGYTSGKDHKRYAFQWNHDKFKNPAEFVRAMKEKGASLVPNVKPGILTTHPLYQEFAENEAFIKKEDGTPDTERYWGGFASFPDFTSKGGRETWKKYMKKSLLENGICGIWDDNNEYEIQNAEATAESDGARQPVAGMRPVMPNMMALTARQALAEAKPDVRPFVVSRAGFAGIQRYAQTWAGDNFTSWKTLKYNIPTILGMGLSGVANQGCDIGGWFGPAPEPELLVRWFQNGIFQPRFMTNSSNTDNTVTEPFMYPSFTPYISKAVKLRYTLVPYLYALLRLASVKGDPVMRPLVYEFQDDPHCWDESFEFMFGPSILVANVLEKGATEKSIYLPAGSDWYDWKTKQKYAGGQTITIPVTLDSIPMFLRSGAIVPLAHGLTNLHLQDMTTLNLEVQPSVAGSFTLYEDDGESNAYLQNGYLETTFTVTPGAVTTIAAHCKGEFQSKIQTVILNVFADTVEPFTIDLGAKQIKKYMDVDKWDQAEEGWYYNMETKTACVKYQNPTGDYQIRVNYEINDLVKM